MWHWKEKGGIAYLKMESQGFVLKCVLGSTTLGNGFGALEKFHDFFEYIFWFLLAKAHPLPLFNFRGVDFFNSLSSSNIEIWENGEIWEMY